MQEREEEEEEGDKREDHTHSEIHTFNWSPFFVVVAKTGSPPHPTLFCATSRGTDHNNTPLCRCCQKLTKGGDSIYTDTHLYSQQNLLNRIKFFLIGKWHPQASARGQKDGPQRALITRMKCARAHTHTQELYMPVGLITKRSYENESMWE